MISRTYKKYLITVLALTKCSKNVVVSVGPEQITERQAMSQKREVTCLRSLLFGSSFGRKQG